MLTTLRIKNLALVADLTLELQPGCNVITGETGAGKSIIIGALNLVLGERADRTLIRNGSDSCSVEAVFNVARPSRPPARFSGGKRPGTLRGPPARAQAHLHPAGTNRQFVNGSPTTLDTSSPRSANGWWTCTARMIINPSCIPPGNSPFWMPSAVWPRTRSLRRLSAAAPRSKPRKPR